ncbi:DNA polymerase III subunit delta' [Hyphomonas sp.]|uniref:DNA polymerase III subunit delta' n=1 Tax=Hyphomonas sp. TaxID=87 RepID=UPI0035285BB4
MTAALPLFGHSEAELAFASAAASGRMHHAWMIEGPSGIGKSRFALRCAAWLLGARGPAEAPFDAGSNDPVMSRCLSGGHPDLRILTREQNDKGKLKQDISIEQIRAFNEFFTYRPALGGWRVGIVDSLDELNRNSSNAILKTLEEPPSAAIMFLINHGSKPVLPTIRSRCRTLRLHPLTKQEMAAALQLLEFHGEPTEFPHGRPGLAVERSSETCRIATNAARTLMKSMPRPNDAIVTRAIQAAGADGSSFAAFRDEVLSALAHSAIDAPQRARVWLNAVKLIGETDELNMDPEQAAAKLISGLVSAPGRS